MSSAIRPAGESLVIAVGGVGGIGRASCRQGGELDRIRALLVLGAIALAFCAAGRLIDSDATGTRFALDAARREYSALQERQGVLRDRLLQAAWQQSRATPAPAARRAPRSPIAPLALIAR